MTINYLDSKRISTSPDSASAWTFDGSNDYVQMPAIVTGYTFAVSTWIKVNTSGSRYTILTDNAVSNGIYLEDHSSSNGLRVGHSLSGGDFNSGIHVSNDGNWHHLVFNVGAVNEIFLDGTSLGTGGSIISSSTSFQPTMGARGSATDFLDGGLAKMGIWNRNLTSSEVTSLYENAEPSSISSGLVASYNFEQTGSQLTDQTNSYNGTNNGATSGGTASIPHIKPTNVQDNSILVEKDTGNRYWLGQSKVSSNDGTNNGATTGATGKTGSAWDFNGSNDYVQSGFTDNLGTQFSVSMWMKFDSIASWESFMGKGTSDSNEEFIFYIGSGSNCIGGEVLDDVSIEPSSGCTITPNFTTWYHVTYTVNGDAGSYIVYIGNESGTPTKYVSTATTVETNTGGTNNIQIGGNTRQGSWFDGKFDQILVYNKVLTQTEVNTLHNSGSGTTTPDTSGLILYYNFDQTGNTLENQVTTPTWTRDNFIPTEISDMKGWWDASDSTTITKNGSNIVSQWNDKSGNGYNMVTNGGDPLWTSAGKNGLDIIDFAGSKSLKVTAEVLTQPTTYCLACLIPVDDGNSRVIFRFGVGTYTKYIKTSTAGQLSLESASGNSATPNVSNTWQSQTLIVNGTSSEIKLNNVSQVIGNSGTDNPSNVWYLQVNATNNNQYGDSKIGELIVYEKILSATELAEVNTYLVNKWGL